MTPKEKAKELVDKFSDYADIHDEDGCLTEMEVLKKNAKQCALIAVDLVIDNIEDDYLEKELNYWKEVKQEIENL